MAPTRAAPKLAPHRPAPADDSAQGTDPNDSKDRATADPIDSILRELPSGSWLAGSVRLPEGCHISLDLVVEDGHQIAEAKGFGPAGQLVGLSRVLVKDLADIPEALSFAAQAVARRPFPPDGREAPQALEDRAEAQQHDHLAQQSFDQMEGLPQEWRDYFVTSYRSKWGRDLPANLAGMWSEPTEALAWLVGVSNPSTATPSLS